ncbi:exopolysaccharide biosynthesis protein [Phenylobacterium hankyongense]|uniref:Exopolysaccharide biosynthesis protein n=1 Tax=Phenylobacterium hankyongense TaxID=1813876 RepID=A0A328B9X3_9CAUL|nr:sugar transferase [Phenylobacterium hankyongense]RAK61818.1 exopolysaccharide biosynthesis protein [Phenylobacterium hankyongense]
MTDQQKIISDVLFEDISILPRQGAKRLFDATLAAFAALILLPLFLLIAVAIFIEDGGQILFLQERTGLGGRKFRLYKFRSMRAAAPQPIAPRPAAGEPEGPTLAEPELRQATRGDARVTRVGAVLRRLSWDELPQLLNILKGDMSLVGPRPHAVSHDRIWAAEVPNYGARFRVRPGLTGYAQVNGFRGELRDADSLVGRVQADNFYIDNWSLLLDMKIIIMTVPALFHDPNAY